MNHKYGWPFNQPVDPEKLEIPDYLTIITHPMDLGTIKENLEHNKYDNVEIFAEHVNLVWANALKYNQPGSDIVIMAKELKDKFQKKWEELHKKWASNEDTTDTTPQTNQTNQTEAHPVIPPPSNKKTEPTVTKLVVKPPKQEPVKKMTFEEKRQLCILVNNLESKYLGRVVRIIHKAMSDFPKVDRDAEELEINIESLDDATLRELEAYAKEVTQNDS